MRAATGELYAFSAKPEALRPTRHPGKAVNIMYDPRVVRGTTLSRSLASTTAAQETKTAVERTIRPRPRPKEGAADPFAPNALQDEHLGIDLSAFLEERRIAPVTSDVDTQTDSFLPQRPPSPYRPPKSGVDAGVQVDPDHVFVFDREVEPLLEVITGKTLEQALQEVEEEAELEALYARRHELEQDERRRLEAVRAADASAAAAAAERARELRKARMRARVSRQCAHKVIAGAVGRSLAREAAAGAVAELRAQRRFHDADEDAADHDVLAVALRRAAARPLEMHRTARALVDDLLASALSAAQDAMGLRRAEEARAAREAERRRRYAVSIVLRGIPLEQLEAAMEAAAADAGAGDAADGDGDGDAEPGTGADTGSGADRLLARLAREEGVRLAEDGTAEITVGPVPIARADQVRVIEDRIMKWLREHPKAYIRHVLRGRMLRLAFRDRLLERESTLDDLETQDLARLQLLNLPDPEQP